MNILITGANGQLGNEMRCLAAEHPHHHYLFTDINQVEGKETLYLDICDAQAVQTLVEREKINLMVNCAAYTNVDAAETHVDLAEQLNARAPEILAQVAAKAGALLIHISTDYVFGAENYNTPCKEDQQGTPTGVYGLSKLHGEQKIMASGCAYVIVRTAWLYSEYGKNFCKTMMQLTSTKPQLKVVFDQVGTPTYALDLARAIMTIIADYEQERAASLTLGQPDTAQGSETAQTSGASCGSAGVQNRAYSKCGIYHYSNEGVCSWFDFAKMIATYNGSTACDIQPCHSEEFPSAVQRPAYSVLDKTKIKSTFSLSVPYWTDSLKICIEALKQMESNQ